MLESIILTREKNINDERTFALVVPSVSSDQKMFSQNICLSISQHSEDGLEVRPRDRLCIASRDKTKPHIKMFNRMLLTSLWLQALPTCLLDFTEETLYLTQRKLHRVPLQSTANHSLDNLDN